MIGLKRNNLGIKKKSFTLYYNNGEIWSQHLDSIDNLEDMKRKFDQDLIQMAKPSTSSFVAIVLNQSAVNKEFLQYILDSMMNCGKTFQRIVFIGLSFKLKRYVRKHISAFPAVITCMDNLDKAKEWLL